MSFPLPEAQLKQLKMFIELLSNPMMGPTILHAPQMSFFRDYLVSMGATLPPKPTPPTPAPAAAAPEAAPAAETKEDDREEEDEEVCGVERDVVDEANQPFGNPSEVTDDMLDQSDVFKNNARDAYAAGDYSKAVELYTQAILNNPGSASLIAKRAEAFLKMMKPMAAIHDCDKAIELNKNAAGAYYVRGKARALLGEWENALHDMQVADQLDDDCGAYDLLKEYREKGEAAKAKRIQKEKKKAEKRSCPVQEDEHDEGVPPQFGGGGMPDLMGMFGNPKIQKMMQEMMSNPAKMQEYMNDPEVGPILQQAMGAFGASAEAEPENMSNPSADVDVD